MPGLGTLLYGKWERALAQFLLTFLFLIGWVWAISDGIVIARKAWEPVDPKAWMRASRPASPEGHPAGQRQAPAPDERGRP